MCCNNDPCAVSVGKVYATLTESEGGCQSDCRNTVQIGEKFANLGAINNAVAEIVSPADNRHGLIIRTCGANGSAPTVVELRLFADTQPPAAYNDKSRRVVYFTVTPPSDNINYPLYIPPGQGSWLATRGEGWLAISYDLLEENDCRQ